MDKCFACSNYATYILPCYHKICDVCLNDISNDITVSNEMVCLCYPNDDCDKQCLTRFKQDDVLLLSTTQSSTGDVSELCSIHNEQYTSISECFNCVHLECDKCSHYCPNNTHYTCSINIWKKHTLSKIQKFKTSLIIKNNGLNCMIEIIDNNHSEYNSIVKQIENIIDTIYITINHIDNFNLFINKIPISHSIKRKGEILNTKIDIKIDMVDRSNKILNEIIKHEADINRSKALWSASINGCLDIVECLIKYGANIHVQDEYALKSASERGHLAIVESLVKNGANIHVDHDYAFRYASLNGHLAVVEYLIENGADINATREDNALYNASVNGHLDIVKYLISHGAYINAQDDLAIRGASLNGYLIIVEYLIEHGADIHAQVDFAFRCAAEYGHLDVVEYLINHGADIHAQDDYAYRWASKKGHSSIVELLIKHGVDKNINVLQN